MCLARFRSQGGAGGLGEEIALEILALKEGERRRRQADLLLCAKHFPSVTAFSPQGGKYREIRRGKQITHSAHLTTVAG